MNLFLPIRSKCSVSPTGRGIHWPRVRLGDVAEHTLGKMLDAQKNRGRLLPYLRNPNVKWFNVDLSEIKEMPFEEHEDERYGLRRGDVLICEGGEAGRAAIWDGSIPEMKFQKAIHRVRVGPNLHNAYLVHCLMYDYFNNRLGDYYTGATIKHFTGQDLHRYEFPLPPLPEQRRIAAILDAADALRQKRRHALRLLDQLSQSIFIEMFGDPATNPKGWREQRSLGEIAEIVSGITKGRKLNGQSTRGVPYLAVYNVQDRALRMDQVKSIDATDDEIERYVLRKDDLLLTEGGDPDKLGRGTLWNDELPVCIHQNHIFRVRARANEIEPLFLNWLVGSKRGKQYFLKQAKQTTGIASINMTQLRSFPLLEPPLSLQREFSLRMRYQLSLAELHGAAVREVDGLFASIQDRAFRGEL